MRSARSLVARAANRGLAPAGFALVRRSDPLRATMAGALRQLAARGLAPRTVLDVGAAYGDWSRAAAGTWPESRFVLAEPLAEYRTALERSVEELGARAKYVESAVGAEGGETVLHVHPDLVGSSTRPEQGIAAEQRTVPVARLDDLVRDVRAEPPFLLKLDVQGAEIDVLRGAETTLRSCEAIVLEALLFEFYAGCPLFADVVAELGRRGFALYDAVDLAYRPLDGALAQADLLFVPAEGLLRRDHRFATREQRRALDARLDRPTKA